MIPIFQKVLGITLYLIMIPDLSAKDWPQWLGPNRDGTVSVSLKPWNGELPVAWEIEVGEGHSFPIVGGRTVFLHHKANDRDEEVLTAWSLDGKQLWQMRNTRKAFSSQFGDGPRATPVYSAGRIYSLGVTGLLICRDAATGKEIWQKDLLAQFQAKNLFFGISSSPLVDEQHVYVMPGGQMGSVVAFNKVDGTVAWTAGKDAASYASPMLTAVEGQTVLVFQTQVAVVGLNPQDGTEFFRIPLRDLLNESSTTPVRIGDILFASSVTFGSLGSRLRRIGEKVEVQPVWRNNSLTCYFGTPVVHGEYLYAVTGQLLKPRATLHCIDPKTGTSRWNKPGVGTYHATLLKTREHLLMLEEQGDLVLVEPYPAEYRELSRTKVCSMTWAHPAYAQGLLLVRDARTLKAIRLPVQ